MEQRHQSGLGQDAAAPKGGSVRRRHCLKRGPHKRYRLLLMARHIAWIV
jgi:hypothetical protein